MKLNGKIEGFFVKPKMPLNTAPSKLRNLLYRDFDKKAKPLFIVDGKEVLEIENLQSNTINSVNVLKGPDASKQFGKKGENGVVIITTKPEELAPKKN